MNRKKPNKIYDFKKPSEEIKTKKKMNNNYIKKTQKNSDNKKYISKKLKTEEIDNKTKSKNEDSVPTMHTLNSPQTSQLKNIKENSQINNEINKTPKKIKKPNNNKNESEEDLVTSFERKPSELKSPETISEDSFTSSYEKEEKENNEIIFVDKIKGGINSDKLNNINKKEKQNKQTIINLDNYDKNNNNEKSNLKIKVNKSPRESINKNKSIIQSKNVLKEDPFHFLFFLLQFIHFETNVPKNPNYNINLLNNQSMNNKQNDVYMFNLYKDFFNQTQNSLISNNFYNIERYLYECPNCKQYYNYGMKTVLRIDVEEVIKFRNNKFPMNINNKIDLRDCFYYYNDKITLTCENCGNPNTSKFAQICKPARVLMIAFERNYNGFNNDIDFPINLDLSAFINQNIINNNTNYSLVSCISYDNNSGKYFADCCIKSSGYRNFYRFIDNQISYINDKKYIYQYEPQVLIYELKNYKN